MVAWSLVVDKVHLRASTGIDWTNPRPLRDVVDISITKIAGLWATWSLVGFVYCLCRWYWRGQYLFAMDVISGLAPLLFFGAIPYVLWLDRVLVNPRDASWHFGAMLIGRESYDTRRSGEPPARVGGEGLLLRLHVLDHPRRLRQYRDAGLWRRAG